MKIFQFFNKLYERLLDIKEDTWLESKAATMPFMVIFTAAVLVLLFSLIFLIQMFWKP